MTPKTPAQRKADQRAGDIPPGYRVTEGELDEAIRNLSHWSMLPSSPGVYVMSCVSTGRLYIGRSKNMQKRAKAHLSVLRGGATDNATLLEDFRQYGEQSMRFAVVVERLLHQQLVWSEWHAISLALQRDCYNKNGIQVACHQQPSAWELSCTVLASDFKRYSAKALVP